MAFDLDKCIERVKGGDCLSEEGVLTLCRIVVDLLIEEATVQPVSSPVTICGDIHGQFYDLLELLKIGYVIYDGRVRTAEANDIVLELILGKYIKAVYVCVCMCSVCFRLISWLDLLMWFCMRSKMIVGSSL